MLQLLNGQRADTVISHLLQLPVLRLCSDVSDQTNSAGGWPFNARNMFIIHGGLLWQNVF